MSAPLGVQMRTARQRVGMSIAEVARRAHTSRSAIHAYESGSISPSLDTAQRILCCLGYELTIAETEQVACRPAVPGGRKPAAAQVDNR